MSRKKKMNQKATFTRKDLVRLGWAVLAIGVAVFLSWALHKTGNTIAAHQQAMLNAATPAETGWSVGQLRANGLRIIPSGRNDASAVLDPNQFEDKKVRSAYWIATQIPEILNQLYCWCGCENRGVHRSNLGCFEDRMGVNCDVCQGTAEIAYEMVQKGITAAGKIQAAVDAEWAPPGA